MPETEMQNVRALMRRRMVAAAFGHLDAASGRTAAFLRSHGFGDSVPERRTDLETDRAIQRALKQHNWDIPGPLLFLPQDENNLQVVEIADFLFALDKGLRGAVLDALQAIAGLGPPPLLTPRSKRILEEQAKALLSDAEEDSCNAAIALADAFRDDFFLNLAGLRQCLPRGFEEGCQRFSGLVFRPTVSSVDSIDIPACSVSGHREKLQELLDTFVSESETLEELAARYYAACGHIPLADALSLGGVVQSWLGRGRTETSVWESIWGWVDKVGSPVARYHACQVFVHEPSLIPEGRFPLLWEEMVRLFAPLLRKDVDTPNEEIWGIRLKLAQYYCRYLECQLPFGDGETLAAFAWWLSEQVATLFGSEADYLKKIREGPVQRHADDTDRQWYLAHPTAKPSSLRYATLFTPSVWGLSALMQAVGKLYELQVANQSPDAQQQVRGAMIMNLAQGFPLQVPDGARLFAFERPVTQAAEEWLKREPDPQYEPLLRDFINTMRALESTAQVEHALKEIPSATEVRTTLVTNALRAKAYAGELDPKLISDRLCNEAWCTDFFTNCHLTLLEVLFDAFLEATLKGDEDGRLILARVCANACAQNDIPPDRQGVLLGMVILTAAAADTMNALRSLVQNQRGKPLSEHLDTWRGMLTEINQGAAPWIAGKARALLAELSE